MKGEIIGRITDIFAEERPTEKLTKRVFWLKTNEQYANHFAIELVNANCSRLDNFNIGDFVKCDCEVNGRQWTSREGKVMMFTTIKCWNIQIAGNGAPQNNSKANAQPQQQNTPYSASNVQQSDISPLDDQELPF